ncbi:hybrid sensor histidine kinase/response regulator transcription factor [Bacteroides sp.]|uniref:hybrid sensor histidine kinase/response regulator transcription factor n=1 Tax=Bacteroides sp. TaxID=29523 RepID=UPI003AB1A332
MSVFVAADLFAGSFQPLSVREGLSSRQVFQINKDSVGFVWAYTHMGIDRYDGNEIKHYGLGETDDSKDHIQSSTIMTCDKAGNIWVALKNGKVYAYDRQTDSFRLRVDLSKSLPSTALYNILFDAGNHLWLCTSDGIYSWQEKTGASLAGLKGHGVNCLVQVSDEQFFAGTTKGAYQLTKGAAVHSFTEQPVELPMEMHVEELCTSGSRLFLGTFSNGVFVLDRTSQQIQSLNDFVPHVPIRAFAKAKDGTLLIGADGAGVFKVDAVTGELLNHYTTDEDDEKSLNGNTVSDICVDEYGGIWVSTSTNGISYLGSDIPDIHRITHTRNNSNSLKSDHVNVLFQDSEGDCWYGTNNGVSLYQSKLQKWTHFLDGLGHSAKVVLALAEDANGSIWVGGYGTGVYCIHKKTGRVRKIETRNQHSDKGMATDYIYAIYSEGDNLWFGGIEGELTCYDTRTDTYAYYPMDCIGDIKPGKDGTLLIAACEGLAVFDKTTGETQWYRQFGDVSLHYPIRCLIRSLSGDIWMATDGEGLIRFNPDNKEVHTYTTNDGLASNSINSLLEDNEGRIWFSTEKELYCLDLAENVIINANDFLGISWGYYNPNAAVKLDNGYLAFGTAEGAITFAPSLNFGQHDSLDLIFTDFKLLYESVKAGLEGSLLKTNINDTQEVGLKYNQNSFSISFSAINFTSPHRIRYEYMLDGYNEQWEHSNTVRSVNYMNLSPGSYTFCLRAFDKYTGQQIGERSLEIVINHPYWISWWALLIYFILIAVFVYMCLLYRKHKANEDKVKEKIRSFISIAHDIRTPVTLIKAPLSELETQEELPEASKKTVAVAAKNVEKLLSMITKLLDLQKAEMHAECLKLSRYDIKAYLEEKMAEFRLAAMQKGVELQLEVESGMPEVWIDREKMDHIIDNLLSNALKYTENGTIHIVVKTEKKKWSIEIRDTGIGIPKEEQGNIFHEYYRAQNAMSFGETGSGIGLMITRRVVKQHHGNISFSSVEGKGTTFTVTFPLKIKSSVVVESKEDNQGAPATAGTPQERAEDAGKNVLLLAEDDPDMREYLMNSLSSEYKVIGVPDGGKALEMAKEINPDIIISDIVMPVLEGDELCRILKSSVDTSHIPIILLTALSERENIIFGLEAGANDYIIKPFDLSVLKARIRNILQSRQHLRETVLSMDPRPEETDYTSQLDKEFLDKVMIVVDEELSNSEFAINDFCRKLGMSRTSVYNKIKTLTGQGPNDFIRIVRLNKAKELLASQRYSISEVANMVGFADPKYFSTCFKKQFGISPSKI